MMRASKKLSQTNSASMKTDNRETRRIVFKTSQNVKIAEKRSRESRLLRRSSATWVSVSPRSIDRKRRAVRKRKQNRARHQIFRPVDQTIKRRVFSGAETATYPPVTSPQISCTSIAAIMPTIIRLNTRALTFFVIRMPSGMNIITGMMASKP